MKKIIAISTLLATTQALAWSTATSDHVWRSGWAQGITEAQVTLGSGNEIYIACKETDDMYDFATIYINLAGRPVDDEVLISFDKQGLTEYPFTDGALKPMSRAHESYVRSFFESIRKHNQIYVRSKDGREATFTLKGAAKATEDCQTHW